MGHSIPIIDLAPLHDGIRGAQKLAPMLRHALEQVGFLLITNHDIPSDLVDLAFAEAKRFHDQPLHEKIKLKLNEHNNGYMMEGRYNVRTSRVSDETAKPDANEAFFLKRERLPNDPLVIEERRFAGPNQWPHGLNDFRNNILKYTNAVDTMTKRLLHPLALSLKLPPDFFDEAFEESQFSFRLSHYPPARRTEGLYGIAPHTDINFMTFLPQSSVAGLQISVSPGRWYDVPNVANSFVVNTGDTLHRWSNQKYLSTPHRVIPQVDHHRYAIPFFMGPHLDTRIECLPTCTNETNPPKFRPITYGDYLTWWYDANYNNQDQSDVGR